MKRALFALLLAASVVAVAQEPKAKPAPAKATPAAPAKVAPAAPAKAAAASTAIVANKDSKVYHRADCKLASKMKDANKVSLASAAEANKAGYKACKVCKP